MHDLFNSRLIRLSVLYQAHDQLQHDRDAGNQRLAITRPMKLALEKFHSDFRNIFRRFFYHLVQHPGEATIPKMADAATTNIVATLTQPQIENCKFFDLFEVPIARETTGLSDEQRREYI